ncbi:hypothetical protein, partial [Yersinia pestis]
LGRWWRYKWITFHPSLTLIAYDGLPDDSLLDIAVTPIVQNTRTSVGKQIASMICDLLGGKDPKELQVLWQPEIGEGETDGVNRRG